MLNHAVGKRNIVTPVRHSERTSIPDERPDVVIRCPLSVPPETFRQIERVYAIHGRWMGFPEVWIPSDVKEGVRGFGSQRPEEKSKSAIAP